MVGDIIGTVTLKDQLTKTEYYWGPISDIEGKILPVLEVAIDNSSYMCIVEGKGLVDVATCDVDRYTPRIGIGRVIDLMMGGTR